MELIDRLLGRPTLQVLVGDVRRWLRANGNPRVEINLERKEALVYQDSEPIKIYLGNLWGEYQRTARNERQGVVARFMSAFNEAGVPDAYDQVKPLLLPVLRTVDALGVARLATVKASEPNAHFGPAYRPFVADLATALVVDRPTSMAYMTAKQLDEWGVSFEQALDDAVRNLRGLPQDGNWVEITPGVWSGEWDDAYDSSRLHLPDLINRLNIVEPVAFVPYRNVLMVTSARNEQGIHFMLALAEQHLEQNTRWLSFKLLKLEGKQWSEHRPPSNSKDLQAKLDLLSQADDYSSQKQMLDQLHDGQNIDIFVATYSLLQREGEPIRSHAVWTEGVDTLLPKTETITLLSMEGEKAHQWNFEWSAMVARFGALLEPTEHQPIRYRVRSFPARTELDAEHNESPSLPLSSDEVVNESDSYFSPEELVTLRAHGVVLFSDRVIFAAQPPMPSSRIAEVQAACAGPLPEQLLALWAQTAGGQLDYDLTLPMNGNVEAVSWTELFWHDSDGYRDLQGWIEHEMEVAEEAADKARRAWSGKLSYLPIGGFEYLDRIYAVVKPGPEHGRVEAWKQGLSGRWKHALHDHGISTVAPDLRAAFAALHLDEDPLAPVSEFFTGQSLFEYLEERREDHGLEPVLIEKLVGFYRRAMVDWRTPLTAGTLTHHPALVHAAVNHAIAKDDAQLVAELARGGLGFQGPQQGSAMATDVALRQGAFSAAMALVRAGAPVAPDALTNVDRPIAPELVEALLANGAIPDATAIVNCAACGATDSARLIARTAVRAGIDLRAEFAKRSSKALDELKTSLQKVREGKLGHYLGVDGLSERIDHLERFRLD